MVPKIPNIFFNNYIFLYFFQINKIKNFHRWTKKGNQAKQQLQTKNKETKKNIKANRKTKRIQKYRKIHKEEGGKKFK